MVGADIGRVPFRHLAAGVDDHVLDQPQRRRGREDVSAAREIFLQDVVLHRAGELGACRRPAPRRARHRARAARRAVALMVIEVFISAERDALEQAPHVAEMGDRHADLADLAARERVVRSRSRSGSADRRRPRARSDPWRGSAGKARWRPWPWNGRHRCGTARACPAWMTFRSWSCSIVLLGLHRSMQAVQGQHGPPRPINHEAPAAKRKGGASRRRLGSSLRCFVGVEALLPTCCRPCSVVLGGRTRPCPGRCAGPARLSRPLFSDAVSAPELSDGSFIAPPLLGALPCRPFRGPTERPGSRRAPCLRTLLPGALSAVGSTMVMSLLAPGASSARAAVVPSPKARAVVKRASFSLIEVSFQTGSWGKPLRRWPPLAVILSLRAHGPRGNVWAGEGFLPGRSTYFDLWAGALFLLGLLARSRKVWIFGRSRGAFGALLRVKGARRKYVAVAR